ncbi:hypothetical protein EJ04DRAFT_94285 [Polyplosphaeria fusca]|uniref:Uncharacterized protein n=1 Tax=Polyplosphaeria fusca TaxID=682080 RepID=A0A9P4R1F6_9PLEO|nr:hypothetical protein EJ04DRAFT_94285 [Polyplosphaeria fusca]
MRFSLCPLPFCPLPFCPPSTLLPFFPLVFPLRGEVTLFGRSPAYPAVDGAGYLCALLSSCLLLLLLLHLPVVVLFYHSFTILRRGVNMWKDISVVCGGRGSYRWRISPSVILLQSFPQSFPPSIFSSHFQSHFHRHFLRLSSAVSFLVWRGAGMWKGISVPCGGRGRYQSTLMYSS